MCSDHREARLNNPALEAVWHYWLLFHIHDLVYMKNVFQGACLYLPVDFMTCELKAVHFTQPLVADEQIFWHWYTHAASPPSPEAAVVLQSVVWIVSDHLEQANLTSQSSAVRNYHVFCRLMITHELQPNAVLLFSIIWRRVNNCHKTQTQC